MSDLFTPYDIKKFQKIFFEAIRLFQEKSCNYELLCKAKILELTDCILSQFCGGSIADTDGELSTIVAAKNYIDSNFLSVITLDFLSNQFYMNKYTMMRKFKSLYKQNIISYSFAFSTILRFFSIISFFSRISFKVLP